MDKLPQRKNIRLQNYDYSQAGYYLITICTKNKKNLFWDVGATFGRPSLEYQRIYEYVETNPLKWQEDKYYI